MGTDAPAFLTAPQGHGQVLHPEPDPEAALDSTYRALERGVAVVSADCAAIGQTLDALNDALGAVSQSGDTQAWNGFGLAGLPILAALRAIRGVATQLVRQQTGESLTDWVDFVAAATGQFDAYVRQLQSLSASPSPGAGASEQLRALSDVRWHTRMWKATLERVTRAGQLVDALLQAGSTGPGAMGPGALGTDEEGAAGLPGRLQRRLKDAGSGALDKSGELREWLMRPLVDVKERVVRLPDQVAHLADEIALLEVLLDLAIAQLRARSGDISGTDARIVEVRVAAAVVLPELAEELTQARRRVAHLEECSARLRAAHTQGSVAAQPFRILEDEYGADLGAARARLSELEDTAARWRRAGPAVIGECIDRAEVALAVLDARQIAEQSDPDPDHRLLLRRELGRLDEVKGLLRAL